MIHINNEYSITQHLHVVRMYNIILFSPITTPDKILCIISSISLVVVISVFVMFEIFVELFRTQC